MQTINSYGEVNFFFNEGIVASTSDSRKIRSSQFYLGKILGRTLRYVFWEDDGNYNITDRLLNTVTCNTHNENYEDSEEARKDTAAIKALWKELKAKGE